MGTSEAVGSRLHEALHRLPGMPAHARAPELNANAAARRRHHRSLPNPPLRNAPLRSPGAHHEHPPRVLVRWQAWIGRHLGQGQR
jgi:hypothetical protein